MVFFGLRDNWLGEIVYVNIFLNFVKLWVEVVFWLFWNFWLLFLDLFVRDIKDDLFFIDGFIYYMEIYF